MRVIIASPLVPGSGGGGANNRCCVLFRWLMIKFGSVLLRDRHGRRVWL